MAWRARQRNAPARVNQYYGGYDASRNPILRQASNPAQQVGNGNIYTADGVVTPSGVGVTARDYGSTAQPGRSAVDNFETAASLGSSAADIAGKVGQGAMMATPIGAAIGVGSIVSNLIGGWKQAGAIKEASRNQLQATREALAAQRETEMFNRKMHAQQEERLMPYRQFSMGALAAMGSPGQFADDFEVAPIRSPSPDAYNAQYVMNPGVSRDLGTDYASDQERGDSVRGHFGGGHRGDQGGGPMRPPPPFGRGPMPRPGGRLGDLAGRGTIGPRFPGGLTRDDFSRPIPGAGGFNPGGAGGAPWLRDFDPNRVPSGGGSPSGPWVNIPIVPPGGWGRPNTPIPPDFNPGAWGGARTSGPRPGGSNPGGITRVPGRRLPPGAPPEQRQAFETYRNEFLRDRIPQKRGPSSGTMATLTNRATPSGRAGPPRELPPPVPGGLRGTLRPRPEPRGKRTRPSSGRLTNRGGRRGGYGSDIGDITA